MAQKLLDAENYKLEFVPIENTLVLDYFLWEGAWDFKKKPVGYSRDFLFSRFHLRPPLELRFRKHSKSELRIRLKLKSDDLDDVRDNDFFIEFIFTLLGFKGELKRGVLDFKFNSQWINFNYDNLQEAQREKGNIGLKFIFKMHETGSLDNENRFRQEELMEEIIANEEEQRLADMASLLKRDSMDGMFTGRQNYAFACSKAGLLERTLPFAKILLEKKKEGTQCPPDTPIDVILNYILKGEYASISQFDTINLYLMGHYYNLHYLYEECRYLILQNLDYDSLLHAITYADMVQDLELLHILIDLFISNRKEVMECKNWKRLLEKGKIYIKNVIDLAIRKVQDELNCEEVIRKFEKEGNKQIRLKAIRPLPKKMKKKTNLRIEMMEPFP